MAHSQKYMYIMRQKKNQVHSIDSFERNQSDRSTHVITTSRSKTPKPTAITIGSNAPIQYTLRCREQFDNKCAMPFPTRTCLSFLLAGLSLRGRIKHA